MENEYRERKLHYSETVGEAVSKIWQDRWIGALWGAALMAGGVVVAAQGVGVVLGALLGAGGLRAAASVVRDDLGARTMELARRSVERLNSAPAGAKELQEKSPSQ